MSSTRRILAVLDAFTEARPVWQIDTLIHHLGYSRATGYRYVKELVENGLLQKTAAGYYALGPRIIQLDYQLRKTDPVLGAARPVIQDMLSSTPLDIVMTAMYGEQVIDIYRAGHPNGVTLEYGRGHPRPLFSGSAPKVILSCQPLARLKKLYEQFPAEAATAGLGDSWKSAAAYLARIRKAGFYLSLGELQQGVGSAAVPIRQTDGEVNTALTLVGTTTLLQHIGERALRDTLAQAQARIHERLAHYAASTAETTPLPLL